MAGAGISPPPLSERIPRLEPAQIAEKLLDVAVRDWGQPDDPLWQSHHTLAEFLFKKSWNGYDPREPAVLTISVRPTGLTITCKMPSEAKSCTILVRSSGDMFDAINHALETYSGDWKDLKSGPGAQKLREDRKKLRETRKSSK